MKASSTSSVVVAVAMGEEEPEVLESESNVVNANGNSSNSNEEYSFPVLRFDVSPHRTYHFHRQFITPSNPNNFFKAVKWYSHSSSISSTTFFSIPNSTSASLSS